MFRKILYDSRMTNLSTILFVVLFGSVVNSHKLEPPFKNTDANYDLTRVPEIAAKESKEDFFEFPKTSFKCVGRSGGYYADVETDCKVFHICGPSGTQYKFFCSPGTLFNQKYAICDWKYNVNCQLSPNFYFLNDLTFKGEYRTEENFESEEKLETPKTLLETPQKLSSFSPSPPDDDVVDTYSTYSSPLTELQRQHRSHEASNFISTNQQLPFTTDTIKDKMDKLTHISSTGVSVPTQYMFSTTGSDTSSFKNSHHQVHKAGSLKMKPIPVRKNKVISDRKYTETNSGSAASDKNNIFSSGIKSTEAHPEPKVSVRVVDKNSDSKFKLTPAVLVGQVSSPEKPDLSNPDNKFRYVRPQTEGKITRKIPQDNSKNSGHSKHWITVKKNPTLFGDQKFLDQDSNLDPSGVSFVRSSLGDVSKLEDLSKKKNSFLGTDMENLFSNYADWSMKMKLNNMKSKLEVPNSFSTNGFENLPFSSKPNKIRLPLEPPVRVPQTTDGTEIEYIEDLHLPVPISESKEFELPGDIDSFKFVQYLADQINANSLRTQARMDPSLDIGSTSNFSGIIPNKTRKPRIFKIKNKGFRPLSFKNPSLSRETKSLINLIKNQLNLTSSPFSVSLIEVDDPYSRQYESQKLISNWPVADSPQDNKFPNELMSESNIKEYIINLNNKPTSSPNEFMSESNIKEYTINLNNKPTSSPNEIMSESKIKQYTINVHNEPTSSPNEFMSESKIKEYTININNTSKGFPNKVMNESTVKKFSLKINDGTSLKSSTKMIESFVNESSMNKIKSNVGESLVNKSMLSNNKSLMNKNESFISESSTNKEKPSIRLAIINKKRTITEKEGNLENIKVVLDKFTFGKDNKTESPFKIVKVYNNIKRHSVTTQTDASTQPENSTTSLDSSTTESPDKTRLRLTRKGIRDRRIIQI